MAFTRDYIQEIQKFTTSHYWNSGVRITTGLIVPMVIMINQGWLSDGIPFLFGVLFVALTDAPGPIHHRRNGMFMAIALNTFTVFVTSLVHDNQHLVITEVLVFSFFLSMLGIFGARAGAIGTLTTIVMLIHVSPLRHEPYIGLNAILTATGGMWYALLSLALYRLQPYRLVDQALGENLLLTAGYLRARASFYSEPNVESTFNRVMKEQVAVLKSQEQMRELLFKTRQLVGDASPKSRSIMMIFLETLDLFEETMYSYQDYKLLHKSINKELLKKFHRAILGVVADFEAIGLSVQAGNPVKRMPSLVESLQELDYSIRQSTEAATSNEEIQSLHALKLTLANLRGIVARMIKIVLYSRMESYDPDRFPDQELERPESSQPVKLSMFWENFTLKSNTFRYATRITLALAAGYAVSVVFSLSHAYWVMLTIVTILKPVYNLTRARNFQRVAGTLIGVLIGGVTLYLISNTTVLIMIMIVCMLMAYSLLRVNYLGFVTFLTSYIIITFQFLNPLEFKNLIGERLIDTLIGSVIAAIAARFVFPVWQHLQVQPAMKKVLLANSVYILAALNFIRDPSHRRKYNAARTEAIVALTNLSDNFQQMLVEPGSSGQNAQVHQFVIAAHSLTSRISTLTAKDFAGIENPQQHANYILDTLQEAAAHLEPKDFSSPGGVEPNSQLPVLHPLSIILSLAKDIRSISTRVVGQ